MARLTIIGGGPGGYTAAFAAAKAGWQVTLVERKSVGGTCLNSGCIPTKTIKASADALEQAQHLAAFGIHLNTAPVLDMPAVLARKEKTLHILREGLLKSCTRLGVTFLHGSGRVIDGSTVEVCHGEERNEVKGEAVILATGSRVLELPSFPFDGTHILSSDHILNYDRVPERLIIVGGGVVGCEMAFIYRAFGATVTVVEGQNRLLPIPGVDGDISTLVQREMKKRRINAETGRTLSNVRVENGVVRATLSASPFITTPSAAQQKEVPVEADMLLVTVGRAPDTEGLGLAQAGVTTDARGWIVVDEHLQTSVPRVYAIGDALGPQHVMLAHVASTEALCVVDHLCGKPRAMDYSVIPSAIFTSPEIGCVGLSESQAREAGHDVHCATFQMRELGKAQATGELAGFFKLVADAQNGKLLGAHLIGAHTSDMVAEAALCLSMGGTVQDMAHTIHAHPTLAEGMYEAAHALS